MDPTQDAMTGLLGPLKGEYAKQLRTALGPLGPVIRKSCGFFHPLQLNSHPWLLLAQLLASCEENACVMGTLQKTLGWGEVVRGQKVCINQNMRKQTPSRLEREMGRGRHRRKAENTGLASNVAHPPILPHVFWPPPRNPEKPQPDSLESRYKLPGLWVRKGSFMKRGEREKQSLMLHNR